MDQLVSYGPVGKLWPIYELWTRSLAMDYLVRYEVFSRKFKIFEQPPISVLDAMSKNEVTKFISELCVLQGGSNMTGSDFFCKHNCQTLTCTCKYSTYSTQLHTNQSRSYLNHLVY
jgi:hypothetical protein